MSMFRRRRFLIAAGLLLGTPPTNAWSQREIPRVGVLDPSPKDSPYFAGLREGFGDLGHVEGRTIVLEPRFAQGNIKLLPSLATELVRMKVDALVAVGGASVHAAQRATSTIPIVMGFSGDPVAAGFVESYARPGANLTGLTFLSSELAGKRLEMLKQIVPGASRIAVLTNPEHPGEQIDWREAEAAARILDVTLERIEVRKPDDLAGAFERIARARPDGVMVIPEAVTLVNRDQIAAFANGHKLPTISGWSEYTMAGGLISYGPNLPDQFRRVAALVDRVLKGVNPADMPIERASKFELAINLKTAKAIALTMPPSILLRADRRIE